MGMDRGTGAIVQFIALALAGLLGMISGDAKLAGGAYIFFQILFFIIAVIIRANDSGGYQRPYTPGSDESGYPGKGIKAGARPTPSRTVNVKKSNAPQFTAEEALKVAAVPDGIEFDQKEQQLVKMIASRSVSPQEILSRIPRSANIHEYKDALTHLEEIGTIRLEEGRYTLVLNADYLEQKAVDDKIGMEIDKQKRLAEEKERKKREAQIRANAVFFDEEDLTDKERFILNLLKKRELRAQDIIRVIPREEKINPYKDAISHLIELGAINAKPDGTLVYNESFFVVKGERIPAPETASTPVAATASIPVAVPAPTPVAAPAPAKLEPAPAKPSPEPAKEAADPAALVATLKAAAEKLQAKQTEQPQTKQTEQLQPKQSEQPQVKQSEQLKAKPSIKLTESDLERLTHNASKIVEMFKARFNGPFGLDNKNVLMIAAGMAGYACHQAVKANKEPYAEITTADNKKFYMGDSVNKYLLEGEYNILGYCDGFYEHSGLGMTKPDPKEIVKKEAKVIGEHGYRIWDEFEPAYVYNAAKACWEGIYEDMTGIYCKSPSEWPVLYGIVLQNIMSEVARIMPVSKVYNMALECAIYVSKMDDDSI